MQHFTEKLVLGLRLGASEAAPMYICSSKSIRAMGILGVPTGGFSMNSTLTSWTANTVRDFQIGKAQWYQQMSSIEFMDMVLSGLVLIICSGMAIDWSGLHRDFVTVDSTPLSSEIVICWMFTRNVMDVTRNLVSSKVRGMGDSRLRFISITVQLSRLHSSFFTESYMHIISAKRKCLSKEERTEYLPSGFPSARWAFGSALSS